MRYSEVMKELRRLADPVAARKVEHFGVFSKNVLGISAPKLRMLARRIGTDHELSQKLWTAGSLEARALAAMTGDPKSVTKRQMELWVRDFDSWAVCDACCGELFIWTPFALEKAFTWSSRTPEYVKRAGFVLMAEAAIHLKSLPDREFLPMLKAIEYGSDDGRNFVRKSVNWALRQIGKRNLALNARAIRTAEELLLRASGPARWIASDALRELTGSAVQRRLLERSKKSPKT